MKKIEFNIPFFNKKHIKNLDLLIQNKKLAGNQLFSKKCQKILEENFKFKKVLLTDSCSSAFEIIATRLRNIQKKEVIIPSYSYPTVASAFIRNNFKVIFVDTQKNSPFIDKNDLEKKINKNTGCIVIIHHYGYHEDIDYFKNIKKKHNIILIEDAAQSFNLKYKNNYIGTFGDFAALSFHETKNIHCGLGGCLILNNKKYIKKTEHIWNRGTNRSEFNEKKVKKYSWYNLGSNYYPSELQSVILHSQLKSYQAICNSRKLIYFKYKVLLNKINSKNFKIICNKNSNYHSIYLICKNNIIRKKLQNFLKLRNIDAPSHYEPLHISKFFKKLIKKNQNNICKNSLDFSKKILRIPLHLYLDDSDIKNVTDSLEKFNL